MAYVWRCGRKRIDDVIGLCGHDVTCLHIKESLWGSRVDSNSWNVCPAGSNSGFVLRQYGYSNGGLIYKERANTGACRISIFVKKGGFIERLCKDSISAIHLVRYGRKRRNEYRGCCRIWSLVFIMS